MTETKWNFFTIIAKLGTLYYFTAHVEFVADRIWGQPCDYVHMTVIIANMCKFIWAGNKPQHIAGNVTCCTVHGCEKWVSRYAQEVDGFCVITLFMKPLSWFRLQKVKTAGNKLTDGSRSTSVSARISTVLCSPPFRTFCKQFKTSHFLDNQNGHPHTLRVETGASYLVHFWYEGTSSCALPGLPIMRYSERKQGYTDVHESFVLLFDLQ
jgi:hypothetical protein